MELKNDLNERVKKKRGRPKKGNSKKDTLDQAKLLHPKKGKDESLLNDEIPNEKLLLHGKIVITTPRKRGRPKSYTTGFQKKHSSTEHNVNKPIEDMEVVHDKVSTENVDPAQLSISAEDVVPHNIEELNKTLNEDVSPARNVDPAQRSISDKDVVPCNVEEPIKTSNVSHNCAPLRLLRCSVRLKRLVEDKRQKYQNCSMDDEKPVDEASEKQSLLENSIRYRGSSTRGNFLNMHDLSSSNSWTFKFSDDSSDEDYLPDNQKFPNNDLDWSPGAKCLKRKNTKNFPVNTKVKRSKCKEADQVSTKLNYSSADNSSGTSTDNLFYGTQPYHLDSSGKFHPITKPKHIVNPNQTSGCSPTNLTRVSKKNRSRISSKKRKFQLMPESKIIQTPTGLEVKREYSKCQVSQASDNSKKTIEIIDIAGDSGPEDESMNIADCPSKDSTEIIDNVSKNKNLEITPMKLEPTFNAGEWQSILKTQRKRSKSQVFRNSSCASNDSGKVMYGLENSGQEITMKKLEYYLKSEINVGKSPCVRKKQRKCSKQLVSQTSGSSTNAVTETIVASGNSSIQIIPMTNDSPSNAGRTPHNVQRKHSKHEVSQTSNNISNSVTINISDISEDNSLQTAPTRDDSKSMTLNTDKFQNIRDIQRKLQSILKQGNRPNRQVSQACGFPSNRFTVASEIKDSQTASMKQGPQVVPEMLIDKSPNIWDGEISQTSNIAFPVKHQELDVPFERLDHTSSSLISRTEQKVEHSASIHKTPHAFDESIVHCNAFLYNLDDENASTKLLPGCTYCTNFTELDAIATLAAADLDDNPKACIEHEIESTEAMYDKLKVAQPQDGEVELKLKKIAQKNRGLKYGRDFLSSFGSFINASEYFLRSNDLEIT